jgi:hypothetical protein
VTAEAEARVVWMTATLGAGPDRDLKGRTYLDSVEGTDRDAWTKALEYADALRLTLGVADRVVSIERKRARLFYLYLEAS